MQKGETSKNHNVKTLKTQKFQDGQNAKIQKMVKTQKYESSQKAKM